MLSDIHLTNSGGIISTGIEIDDSVRAVIQFIKKYFTPFAENNKRQVALNEKGLNQRLCIFLNQNINAEPFFFQSEFMENVESGISPQVDIGTLRKENNIGAFERQYNDDSFFSMEAKRLPTTGSNREQEYVTGFDSQCGAIERFKKGIHGSRLKYAAIIGYIQEESFNHWFLKINSWIENLANGEGKDLWNHEDKIEKVTAGNSSYQELKSLNGRIINGQPAEKINIFHFWVNLIPS